MARISSVPAEVCLIASIGFAMGAVGLSVDRLFFLYGAVRTSGLITREFDTPSVCWSPGARRVREIACKVRYVEVYLNIDGQPVRLEIPEGAAGPQELAPDGNARVSLLYNPAAPHRSYPNAEAIWGTPLVLAVMTSLSLFLRAWFLRKERLSQAVEEQAGAAGEDDAPACRQRMPDACVARGQNFS